jgi:hypothetical protein
MSVCRCGRPVGLVSATGVQLASGAVASLPPRPLRPLTGSWQRHRARARPSSQQAAGSQRPAPGLRVKRLCSCSCSCSSGPAGRRRAYLGVCVGEDEGRLCCRDAHADVPHLVDLAQRVHGGGPGPAGGCGACVCLWGEGGRGRRRQRLWGAAVAAGGLLKAVPQGGWLCAPSWHAGGLHRGEGGGVHQRQRQQQQRHHQRVRPTWARAGARARSRRSRCPGRRPPCCRSAAGTPASCARRRTPRSVPCRSCRRLRSQPASPH